MDTSKVIIEKDSPKLDCPIFCIIRPTQGWIQGQEIIVKAGNREIKTTLLDGVHFPNLASVRNFFLRLATGEPDARKVSESLAAYYEKKNPGITQRPFTAYLLHHDTSDTTPAS